MGAALGLGRGRSNRYTINPLAHADPIGTVLLPLMAIFVMPQAFLFGWGRPVPFDPYAARRKISRQKMIILVSLAGPIANILQFLVNIRAQIEIAAIRTSEIGVALKQQRQLIDTFAMSIRRIMATERHKNEELRALLAESRTANGEAFGD